MKNRLFVVAVVVGTIGGAFYYGQAKAPVPPKASETTTSTVVGDATREPAKLAAAVVTPLDENLDLSRAFNPTPEEEVSPLVLASFVAPEIKPAPIPLSRYRSMLLEIDAINPTGLRLGWLSMPIPATDILDIMPREVSGK